MSTFLKCGLFSSSQVLLADQPMGGRLGTRCTHAPIITRPRTPTCLNMEPYIFKTVNSRLWNQSLVFQKRICKPVGDHRRPRPSFNTVSGIAAVAHSCVRAVEWWCWKNALGVTTGLKSQLDMLSMNHLPQKRKWLTTGIICFRKPRWMISDVWYGKLQCTWTKPRLFLLCAIGVVIKKKSVILWWDL